MSQLSPSWAYQSAFSPASHPNQRYYRVNATEAEWTHRLVKTMAQHLDIQVMRFADQIGAKLRISHSGMLDLTVELNSFELLMLRDALTDALVDACLVEPQMSAEVFA